MSDGERPAVAVPRPPSPWRLLPTLLTMLVGVGVVLAADPELREAGPGLVVGAVLVGIVVVPLAIGFVVRLHRLLRPPDVDRLMLRGDAHGLIRALWHRDEATRDRAHAALSARTDVATAIALIESIDSDIVGPATSAARSILRTAGGETVDAVGRALGRVTDTGRFGLYVVAMVDRPDLLVQVLILTLRSSEPRARDMASDVLQEYLTSGDIPADMRRSAVDVLRTMADSDADPTVRRAAQRALPDDGRGPLPRPRDGAEDLDRRS